MALYTNGFAENLEDLLHNRIGLPPGAGASTWWHIMPILKCPVGARVMVVYAVSDFRQIDERVGTLNTFAKWLMSFAKRESCWFMTSF